VDVKIIKGIQNYSVSTATENVDQERRRDRQNPDGNAKPKNKPAEASVALTPPAAENKIEPEENELTRQPVDSEKMIELLGNSLPPLKSLRNTFKAVEALSHPNSDKAVNRKL
jgi:hypothetical protein